MNKPSPDIQLLLEAGVKRSEALHQYLQLNPISPMSTWTNQHLFLACLTYAASLAKLVELDRDDFLKLCEGLFDNIQITLPPDA